MPSILRIALAATTLVAAVHGAAQTPLKDSKPHVSSQKLQDTVTLGNLTKRANDLYELAKLSEPEYNHPTRVIGSKGHEGTLNYIKDTVNSLGKYYTVTTQDFPVTTSILHQKKLTVDEAEAKNVRVLANSPPTKDRKPVSGPLVLVANNGCEPSDFPASAKDAVALIRRGDCAFGQKSANAGKTGAVAAIIYNPVEEDFGGTLGAHSPDHVATFGVRIGAAQPWLDKLNAGGHLAATVLVDVETVTINTTNVIAQTRGGDQDNCLVLGGHSDSVAAGPGINDDGSGSLSVLEVAVQLARFQVRNCVRFAWWAAEEEGLLGSTFYANSLSAEENLKVRVFVDLDMLASPNYIYAVYNSSNGANPAGSGELRDLTTAWYASQGLNFTYNEFDGRSDYVGFIRNGIPAGGWSTGAEGVKTTEEVAQFGGRAGEWYDKNYHMIGDDVSNLDLEAWEVNTRLIAHIVGTYALSWDGFPEREKSASAAGADVRPASEYGTSPQFIYEGPNLII
ncbi:hypothetical protein PWT90_04734 [Aphanocladium album]|nr:hypothetical protein PWT90_04734 [Aphanocladium album]